jgi:hypothetical protein
MNKEKANELLEYNTFTIKKYKQTQMEYSTYSTYNKNNYFKGKNKLYKIVDISQVNKKINKNKKIEEIKTKLTTSRLEQMYFTHDNTESFNIEDYYCVNNNEVINFDDNN